MSGASILGTTSLYDQVLGDRQTMALGPRLDLRQSQQLVMTPQLQQAIRLLALTNLELEAYVSSELEKNPLLDVNTGESERDFDGQAAAPVEEIPALETPFTADGEVRTDALLGSDNAMAERLDIDQSNDVFHHNGAGDDLPLADRFNAGGLDGSLGLNGASGSGSFDEDSPGFEALLSKEATLQEHLLSQVGTAFSDPADRLIASHLVDLVDDTGYIHGDLTDVALRLGAPLMQVEAVLQVMQRFDPTGVCARTLAECLKIQARELDRLDPAMLMLLDNLPLLARGDIATLKRLCRVDHEDMADMIREVRSFNPKPGLIFGSERLESVIPDIFVRKNSSGVWQVELNTATLPRVLINRTYFSELSSKAEREDKLFLSECLASANWLVKALDQRARTILKVASEVVRAQEEFFDSGVRGLKPLTLRMVAETIGMHESTVSRVTTNKFLSCARGMFELKYFFTAAISSSEGGEAHSAEAVRSRLRALIDKESVHDIISDDSLVEKLRLEGFDIARRTVAKYREAMKIPSSVQRRRLKSMANGRS
jgi:RNA polymerase sigma-54 factor